MAEYVGTRDIDLGQPAYWCANGACARRFTSRREPGAPVAYPMLGYPEVSVRQPASGIFVHYHRECAPGG